MMKREACLGLENCDDDPKLEIMKNKAIFGFRSAGLTQEN
jgi:hypothetical protein